MYAALLIMICGFILGRFFPALVPPRIVRRAVFAAIILLLFLLGASIGINSELLSNLPRLGLGALIIMLCCTGGSIVCAFLLTKGLAGEKEKKTAGD